MHPVQSAHGDGWLVGKLRVSFVIMEKLNVFRSFIQNSLFSPPGDRSYALALWLMTLVGPQTRQECSHNERQGPMDVP